MAKRLVLHLVGRICLVTKDADTWALFVNARHNTKLGLREHTPLLNVPLSMVASQDVADAAHVTSATFVNPLATLIPTGATAPLVDSLGIWKIGGFDMSFDGLNDGSGKGTIDALPDLSLLAKQADLPNDVKTGIFDTNPTPAAVLARLKFPKNADIKAVTEDFAKKTFEPGGHKQVVATYVKYEADFTNDLIGPILNLKKFVGGRPKSYKFDGQRYDEIHLTMTNLCNCVKPEPPLRTPAGDLVDDPEFGLFYELLKRPPASNKRPVPVIPAPPGAGLTASFGGIRVIQCYNAAKIQFPIK